MAVRVRPRSSASCLLRERRTAMTAVCRVFHFWIGDPFRCRKRVCHPCHRRVGIWRMYPRRSDRSRGDRRQRRRPVRSPPAGLARTPQLGRSESTRRSAAHDSVRARGRAACASQVGPSNLKSQVCLPHRERGVRRCFRANPPAMTKERHSEIACPRMSTRLPSPPSIRPPPAIGVCSVAGPPKEAAWYRGGLVPVRVQ